MARPKRWTPRNDDWKPLERKNEAYERYYKLQRVCKDDVELAEMMETFTKPLPAAFRVTYGCDLRKASTVRVAHKGENAPRGFRWYPDQLAFGWDTLQREEIRKDPKLQEIKQTLIGEADRGAIVRQEAVSMIPPIFIDMKANSACLDLCAAPGSKTSQLLDLALIDAKSFDSLDSHMPQDAAVIANDVNLTRARMLCHQIQRLGHPGAAVTYMDASAYPKAHQASLLYDRVLADVPCSGDGTLRKNIDIWGKFTPRGGLQLHERQLQILLRGMSLVAPGGIVVYSTCSLNPIEDEAVVAAALQASNGKFKLLPVEREGLVKSAGLTEWIVPNVVKFEHPDLDIPETIDSMDQFTQLNQQLDPEHRMKPDLVQPTMFASSVSEGVREQLKLCGRFLPHQNNSGGFFVATLRNTCEDPDLKKPRVETPVENNVDEFFKMQPTKPEDEDIASILSWYGLTETAEAIEPVEISKLVKDSARLEADLSEFRDPRTRVGDLVKDFRLFPLVTKDIIRKRLYLATPRLIDICLNARSAMKFLQCGIKAFERLDDKFAAGSGCQYRIMAESVPWLVGSMRRRVIFITYSVAQKLLEEELSKIDLLKEEQSRHLINLDSLRRKAIDSDQSYLEPGGFVAVCSDEIEAQLATTSPRQLGPLRLACLMSASGNIQSLIKKNVKEAILALLDDGTRLTQGGTRLSQDNTDKENEKLN